MTNSDTTEERIEKAQLLEQVLARVGYAVWQCAECEDTLAHMVVAHLRSARGVGEVAGLKILADARRRTFGQTLRELVTAGVLTRGVEERTANLLDERNWVVHRAKRENRGVFHRPADFNLLLERLDRIGDEATEINRKLGAALEDYVVRSGVSRAVVDLEAARLTTAWGYRVDAMTDASYRAT